VFRRGKSAVGLDIGSSAIKVAELETGKDGARLLKYGVVELLPEAIVEGEIMDRQMVVEAVQNLLERCGIKQRQVATGIAGRGVIVKRITMDRLDPKDAREAIHWEAEQHVPYDISDVSLDFEILGVDAGPTKMQVLLVAAKKELVTTHADLIREAGLDPSLIDVNSFAVQNAAESNYEFAREETIAFVNVGAELTNVNIVRDGIPLYTQDLSIGGQSFIEGLQKRYQINRDEAVAACKEGEDAGSVDIAAAVRSFGDEIGLGIERSLAYLKSNGEADRVDRIFVCGGGARIRGLAHVLAERQRVSVELVDPLRRISYTPDVFGGDDPKVVGPQLTVAIGLALRKAHEK